MALGLDDIEAITQGTKLPNVKLCIIQADRLILDDCDTPGSPCYHPMALGGYSNVYKAQMKTDVGTMKEVAVKVVRTSVQDLKDNTKKELVINRLRREYGIWSTLKHPNIHQVEGVTCLPQLLFAGLVSEFKPLGSLDKLWKTEGVIYDTLAMAQSIASGMEYLHARDVVHGDLTPANILVEKIEDRFSPLITDFGKSRVLREDGYTTTIGNSPMLSRPPELLIHGDDKTATNKLVLTPASDVYAFSMVILELLTSRTPFYTVKGKLPFITIANRILDQGNPLRPTPEDYPFIKDSHSFVWSIMQDCWKADSTERISSQEVVRRLG